MKPGPYDKKYSLRISGRELAELKKFTWNMAEAFGLDRRIEAYQGKRPIGFYPWDLDCLESVTLMALKDQQEYPNLPGKGYEAMKTLHKKIKALRARAYEE